MKTNQQIHGGGMRRTLGWMAVLVVVAAGGVAVLWQRTDQTAQPAPLATRPSSLASPVSDIGDCELALTLTAADGGRNVDLLFSARNGEWLAAGVRPNVERRTSNAERPTGTWTERESVRALERESAETAGAERRMAKASTAPAQAGTPMVPGTAEDRAAKVRRQEAGVSGQTPSLHHSTTPSLQNPTSPSPHFLVLPTTLMVKDGRVEGGVWMKASEQMNIERRTSNAERPTGTVAERESVRALERESAETAGAERRMAKASTATAQAGTPMLPGTVMAQAVSRDQKSEVSGQTPALRPSTTPPLQSPSTPPLHSPNSPFPNYPNAPSLMAVTSTGSVDVFGVGR